VQEAFTTTTEPLSAASPTAKETLEARALEALDFTAVRERVAACATFGPARNLALAMHPSYDPGVVFQLQRETAEGRRVLQEVGDASFKAPDTALAAVTRASLEGVLTGQELLFVAEMLEAQRRAALLFASQRAVAPTLAAIAATIPDLREIRTRIGKCIGMRGEVVDHATPTLAAVRQQVRDAYQRVTDALTRFIQSERGRQALQDQVISMRSDRFVLQVKSEMRHRVPGIVHDASNTGATVYIEPFAIVEMGNQWRELVLEEERETTRVLRELSALVGGSAAEIRQGTDILARLDFILARARYGAEVRGAVPLTGQAPTGDATGKRELLRLVNARHPLLAGNVVPITIQLGPGWCVLVITGPNTGGKTVAMKTVGLLALMHQSGLQLPAGDGSVLPVFDGVYADVGDQQSIQQSVSTFSSHMRNAIQTLAVATPSSLVLLDELGTSTDPEEGSALARAILGHLAEKGIPTIATTHHRNVAAFAEVTPRMANTSVDLDPDTLRPNYRLTMGLPGRSYALKVAARLGLPDEILQKAESLVESQAARFEDLLTELQRERGQLQAKMQAADEARTTADARSREMQAKLDELDHQREELLAAMRREVMAEYEGVRKRLRRAEAALSWTSASAPSAEDVTQATQELAVAHQEIQAVQKAAPPAVPPVDATRLAAGDLVDVRGLGVQGRVVALPEGTGEAEVAIGNVRMRLALSRLSKAHGEPGAQAVAVGVSLGPMLSSSDLDLRGVRAEEAAVRLEEFLDRAVRDGLSEGRVIHGRGTGALRQLVRERLKRHPLVRSHRPEEPERGGDGVTVVELA
jgi:DNA mismatch repair protein MutS2